MDLTVILGLIMLLFIAASCAIWTTIITRLVTGRPVVPTEMHRAVPWGVAALVCAFLIYILLPGVAMMIALAFKQVFNIKANKIGDMGLVLPVTGIGTALAAVGVVGVIRALAPRFVTARDFGVDWSRFGYDLRLGAYAFVAIAPPVFLLQGLLSLVSDKAHPLIESLRESPSNGLFVSAFFVAVIVAPIVEELLFRVVLQGWLENLFGFRGPSAISTDSVPAAAPNFSPAAEPTKQLDPTNPYAVSTELELMAEGEASGGAEISPATTTEAWRGVWPIIISSVIFAGFHIGHGLAPISLFFLALVLGYLYQKTQRIVPCIVVHMILNGLSMTILWVTIYFDLMPPPA